MKTIRIVLLILIIIGIGLLLTQKIWIQPLVNAILAQEIDSSIPPSPVATTTPTTPADSPAQVDSGVEGAVTIGPTCPVERIPPDPACADKPYQTTLVISGTLPGKHADILVRTDAQGHFSQQLLPGQYTIRGQSEGMLPRLSPVTFEVAANALTTLDLQFDSGIR